MASTSSAVLRRKYPVARVAFHRPTTSNSSIV
jgi:hypothetical protein